MLGKYSYFLKSHTHIHTHTCANIQNHVLISTKIYPFQLIKSLLVIVYLQILLTNESYNTCSSIRFLVLMATHLLYYPKRINIQETKRIVSRNRSRKHKMLI